MSPGFLSSLPAEGTCYKSAASEVHVTFTSTDLGRSKSCIALPAAPSLSACLGWP